MQWPDRGHTQKTSVRKFCYADEHPADDPGKKNGIAFMQIDIMFQETWQF